QLYLKGRYHFARRTREDVNKAVENYQQAIKLDPNFALAYARIAEVYNQMPAYPYLSPGEAFPLAKSAATRALELDPNLSEAHTALANTLAVYDWNWPEAEREFKRAIELDQNSAAAHFRYGQLYLAPNGFLNEAIAEMNRGVELEPLDVNMGATSAWYYSLAGQTDKALELAKKSYDLDPNHPVGRNILTQVYIYRGMYPEALAIIDAAQKVDSQSQWDLQNLGVTYAKMGRQNDAKDVIARLRGISRTQYVMSYYIAMIYAALGDRDKVFDELELAYAAHDWRLNFVKVEEFLKPLRDDPRYSALLKRMNLPE
ncbi:MAG: tetratricopeptide repeat protein, partial [Acidobacteriota bacterium]